MRDGLRAAHYAAHRVTSTLWWRLSWREGVRRAVRILDETTREWMGESVVRRLISEGRYEEALKQIGRMRVRYGRDDSFMDALNQTLWVHQNLKETP